MSIFEAYDTEFNSLSKDINKNISEYRNYNSNPDKASNLVRHIDALLSQSTELVKQMEVEVRSHDPATRKVLTEKVSQYKKSLNALKSDFERAKEDSQKSGLFVGSKSAEQRQKLLDTNDKLSRQNELILNATRTVEETEGVAIEITEELARNREKIQSAHSKVHEFTGMTDTARRLIQSMSKREVQQKFLLVFIACVLIIAISVVIYFTTVQLLEFAAAFNSFSSFSNSPFRFSSCSRRLLSAASFLSIAT